MNGVGVDFGTTNSCIAYCASLKRDPVTVNILGKPITPTSVIYEHESNNICVGLTKPLNATTIHNIKRLIGKKYNDPIIQSYIPNFDFPVVEDENGYCAFEVISNGQKITVLPELAAAMVLKYLVSEYNKCQMKTARTNKFVLTIPVAFNHDQKERILFSAQKAGLEVITTIYEPIAAAICHGFMNPVDADILIFDFGGGTLDVTVMHINTLDQQNSSFKVLAISGDANLGGENIDQILSQHFEAEMKQKGYNIRVTDQKKLLRNLQIMKTTSKELKEQLTVIKSADFIFNNGEITFQSSIRRKIFEDLLEANEIPKRITKCIDDALRQAKKKKKQIKNVVCVGGSSNIPMVKKLLSEYFEDEDKILVGSRPEEDIARGASMYAKYILDGNNVLSNEDKIFTLAPGIVYPDVDDVVIPRKLKRSGIVICIETYLNCSVGEIQGDDFDEILEKGIVVPYTREIEVEARKPGQTEMYATVGYKNNNEDTPIRLKNYVIEFGNIPEDSQESVAEQWTVDAGGNLTITSVVKSSGKTYNTNVKLTNNFLTQDQLNDMSTRMTDFTNQLDSNEIYTEASNLIDSARKKSRKHTQRQVIQSKLDAFQDWFDDQKDNGNISVSQYKNKLDELKSLMATYSL